MTFFFATCVAGTALLGIQGTHAQDNDDKVLTVATFGGAYKQAQDAAYFRPFADETGIQVSAQAYDGTLAGILGLVGNDKSGVDVVDLSSAALEALCKDGELEELKELKLPAGAGAVSAADDFLAGGLSRCGVASVAWSTAVAYRPNAFDQAPTRIADLLDIKRFPGKRALPNGPRYTLELALLADGVAANQVYAELGTEAGVDRAFQALDKIRNDILWWNKAQDPLTWLARKRVAMAVSYSGRIFRASVGSDLRALWDGQVYDLDVWAIPKSADNKKIAQRFIAFAAEPQRIAAHARLIAYGPMRKSAIPLVGKHPVMGVEMASYLPTEPQNFQNALKFDEAWWIEHGDALRKRFKSWRAGDATPPASPETTSSTKPQQSPQ